MAPSFPRNKGVGFNIELMAFLVGIGLVALPPDGVEENNRNGK
jgi:hypothetical protein